MNESFLFLIYSSLLVHPTVTEPVVMYCSCWLKLGQQDPSSMTYINRDPIISHPQTWRALFEHNPLFGNIPLCFKRALGSALHGTT